MPSPTTQPAKKPGVSSLWRTATVCLLAGVGLHWWSPTKVTEPLAQGFTSRGDTLPTYDPRLDTRLERIDFDKKPYRDALSILASRVGLNLIITPDLPVPSSPDAPMDVTIHLHNVTAADAMNAICLNVLSEPGVPMELLDVRTQWTSIDTLLYTTRYTPGSNRLYTRFYDIKAILDKRDVLEKTLPPATTRMSSLFSPIPTPGYSNWLDQLIQQQLQDRSGGLNFYGNSAIATGTPEFHRHLESILRQLENSKDH